MTNNESVRINDPQYQFNKGKILGTIKLKTDPEGLESLLKLAKCETDLSDGKTKIGTAFFTGGERYGYIEDVLILTGENAKTGERDESAKVQELKKRISQCEHALKMAKGYIKKNESATYAMGKEIDAFRFSKALFEDQKDIRENWRENGTGACPGNSYGDVIRTINESICSKGPQNVE